MRSAAGAAGRCGRRLLALFSFGLQRDDPGRLADGDRGLGIDLGGDTRRQGEVGNAQLRPDGQAADVDLQRGRDVGRPGLDGQREHLLVDETVPVLHLERLPDQDDGHVGRDDLVAPDDLEVDVGDGLGHRMTLHLTRQGQVGGRSRLEREQLVGPGLAVERDAELAGRHGDRDRVGPVPVDHPGDLPLAAQAARGA
jgi:hypothetical protein